MPKLKNGTLSIKMQGASFRKFEAPPLSPLPFAEDMMIIGMRRKAGWPVLQSCLVQNAAQVYCNADSLSVFKVISLLSTPLKRPFRPRRG